MGSARNWAIPTAVSGIAILGGALAFANFAADFLFTDMCLDRGGMVEAGTCIGALASVTPFGQVPYLIAIGVAIVVTLAVGMWLRRTVAQRKHDDV